MTKTDIGIIGTCASLNTVGFLLDKKTKGLSPAGLDVLQTDQIASGLDRSATKHWSLRAQHRSDVLLKAAVLVPLSLAASSDVRQLRQGGVVAVMGLETMFLTLGLTQTVKNSVRRPRPYAYNTLAPYEDRLAPDARRSFFSGHTSMGTAACFFTAQVYADLYPQSRWRPLVWTGAAVLPATIGLLRYRGGKHFPTDVVAGFAAGAFCGWLVPRLHRSGL